ncbi:OmpP1/FadL family transporter [Alsobacter sp. R-9]
MTVKQTVAVARPMTRRTAAIAALLGGVAAGALACSSSAHAGAFGLREQSAAGQGASFAGAAAGAAGLGSMFWNPATITMAPGMQSETNLSIIVPYGKLKPGAGSAPVYVGSASGDIAEDAVLPTSYGSWQINERFWIGYSWSVPYGLATKPDASFTGRTYGSTTKVVSSDFSPTVGWKVNEWLSLGAGVRVVYFKARYMSATTPTPTANVVGLDGDSWGVGYTLGATVTPLPGTTIGIGFRSMVQQELGGDFQGIPGGPAALRPTTFSATAVLPEQATVGLKQAIGDRFNLLAGVEWTNWSRLRYPRVVNDATGQPLAARPFLPLGYKDGWYFSVGGEYAIDPSWAVRAGLGYELSPIDTEVRSPRLPDNDRIWASIGASYRWNERLSFDVGYTHIFTKEANLALVPGNPNYSATFGPLVGTADAHVDIVSVALRYRIDDPSAKAGVLPVKAKY